MASKAKKRTPLGAPFDEGTYGSGHARHADLHLCPSHLVAPPPGPGVAAEGSGVVATVGLVRCRMAWVVEEAFEARRRESGEGTWGEAEARAVAADSASAEDEAPFQDSPGA